MDVLRLAIVLSGVESRKFDKILFSLVISVFVNNSHINKELSVSQIQKELKAIYDFDFSSTEIEASLKDSKNFIVSRKDNLKYYKYVPGEDERSNPLTSFDINKCICSFYSENKNEINTVGIDDVSTIEKILKKYIYDSFNKGKSELLSLLNGSFSASEKKWNKLSNRDAVIIELFLNWNNDLKDQFIFNLSKTAYDFCVLTLKESPQQSAIAHKKFYLDTNVIFSLAGINGEDKKYSSEAFLRKCKELKIDLRYTNYTKIECENTLNALVQNMISIIKKDNGFSYEELKAVFPSSNPAALFKMYSNWVGKNPRRNGDFNGFNTYLSEELDKCLEKLVYDYIDDTFVSDDFIKQGCASLEHLKNKMGRKHSDNAIKCDVLNYLYINSFSGSKQASIRDIDRFFISFDSALIKWTDSKCNGCINNFVSISLMFSLMLRFTGRTSDDYRSFNTFLSMRFGTDYLNEDERKMKEEIIDEVSRLDIPADAKRRVIVSASKSLTKELANSNAIPDLETIISKEVDHFYKEYEEFNYQEKAKAVEEAKQQGNTEGTKTTLEAIARLNASKRRKRNLFVRTTIISLISLIILGLIALCVIEIINKGTITFNSIMGIVGGVASIAGLVISLLLMLNNKVFIVNKETLFEKELTKLNEEISE